MYTHVLQHARYASQITYYNNKSGIFKCNRYSLPILSFFYVDEVTYLINVRDFDDIIKSTLEGLKRELQECTKILLLRKTSQNML